MAELSAILAAGEIPAIESANITAGGDNVITKASIAISILALDGIPLPEIPAASAGENHIFFNTDNNRVCWKAPGGLIFRFRLQLI